MDSLYLLIPLSVLLVFLILGVFAWALHRGQFDDLEREGQRIFESDPSVSVSPLDSNQAGVTSRH